ncbi:mechanosensitive ion channel family protein [Paraburkholderia phymatum]|uniref:Small-conductance mechanosensitive channel n=1 Tax=Paraburkholderia phymatum (strain DSM 17167 / CIP 108236 / LMG 21445 / STM815) TaxID=391038 RepID=B2JM75_PARP8|nr:mechanosensitive ion channel family protein [Paraburkholderia phymatum]ACC72765.1 cyclic nucleotide-regulated small mechanosensitive ion channel [Paraburkholderia phymatum STM815]
MNNPLIFGFALVAFDVAIWRCAIPKNEVARLLVRLCVYAALSSLLFNSGLSPFSKAPYADSKPLHVLGQVLEIIWWLMGARLLSLALDTLLLPKTWRRQRLFQDVFGALVFLAAVVAALGFVLELPVRGLVATSGALAIVLGLAIQSTLSDVFAGIVINTTEPYHIGNWVAIDGVEGKVLEMNWRATHLLTSQGNIVIVPNAVAAKAKITNSSRPPTLHGITILLEITPEARPGTVLAALEAALAGVRAVIADPAPYALVKRTSAISVTYEATAYVDDMSKKLAVTNELYDLCYRQLEAAGVALRPLGAGYAQPLAAAAPETDPRMHLLRRVEMFAALTQDELKRLAPLLSRRDYERGDTVVTPDKVLDQLTIVDSGVLSVVAEDASGPVEVTRLGPGDALGEAGLLAGMPARVTISALTASTVFQLNKDDLTPLLKDQPDVARLMCQMLSRRRDTLDKLGTPTPVAQSEQSVFQWLLDGMRKLHDLTF